MGYEKDRAIQEDEQGWAFSPGVNVCHRCLTDDELATYVKGNANETTCDFCDRTTKNPSCIPLDNLMEIIGETLAEYYDRAVNALSWDGEDHEYVGTTFGADDLLYGELGEITENQRLIGHLKDILGDELWCDKHPYSTVGYEAYATGWERFCNAVKHQTRYFFSKPDPTEDYDHDITPVRGMLDEISTILENEGLIITAPTTTRFTRVRIHSPSEHPNDWRALGSPPPERAPSNRMSAAGISMFYASTTQHAARAEAIASIKSGATLRLTSAEWIPTRELRLLDLTGVPPVPSFWFTHRDNRDRIRFLHEFAKSITQPVVHDGREHVEYVPTQILAEYFRHEYRTHNGERLDGVLYPSAQDCGGKNIVLFADQATLTPTDEREFLYNPPLLTLDTASIKRLRTTRKRPRP